MKKRIYLICSGPIIILIILLAIKIANMIASSKMDTDYQKLGLELNKYDIDYYTVYYEEAFDYYGVYKVYKLNIYKKEEDIRNKLESSKLWSKEKFYEYIMRRFTEKVSVKTDEIDREDLYYYKKDGVYAIYDLKNAKLYYLKNLIYNSAHEFSEILGVKTKEYIEKEVYDVRGGLQYDGRDYYVYEFDDNQGKNILESLEKNSKWSKEKIEDDKLKALEYNEEVHSIENGYYYYELICRTSDENKKRNVTKENATGYEIGVYDADKNILYYCWDSI